MAWRDSDDNFSLKNKYFLQSVQTKKNCAAGLGDFIIALTMSVKKEDTFTLIDDLDLLIATCSVKIFLSRTCESRQSGLLVFLSVCLPTCVDVSLHLLTAWHFISSSALNFVHGMPTGGFDHRSAVSQCCLFSSSSLIAVVSLLDRKWRESGWWKNKLHKTQMWI